jgi:fatty acid-binding protein DegV
MAQNFRRYTNNNVGTSAVTAFTANSYDTVIGISVSNILSTTVNVDVYINDGTNDIYLVKSAPIVPGSALQVLDGGAKFVMQNGDALKIVSDTAASLDVWTSVVDDISS